MKQAETPPLYTNALKGSASLYLRQHAHNPVMWYPWGEQAITLAQETDRPILLSIGYSACYWCHVMEREVFENASIAAYMNQHFVCIKMDREEYPLLDETYMVARQLLTREGGWPNNVFLTPQLKPYFACGTYGAVDTPQRPSFPRLLEWLRAKWVNERPQLESEAQEIHRLTSRFLNVRSGAGVPLSLASAAHALVEKLTAVHDDVYGGFYKEPKFPHETYLAFLLQMGGDFSCSPAQDAAMQSLHKMAAGGMYDQVGCGFHRYAVDQQWLIPHFEKMLYNQAQAVTIYTKAVQLTGNPYFADIVHGILEFVSGPMRSPSGAFYTAIDAETDGVEGAYYSWKAEEILALLDEAESRFFSHYYALAEIPHFPGHKPPSGQAIVLRRPLWEAARAENIPYFELASLSGGIMNKLLAARNQRQAPYLDDKLITSWNGLMIEAYANACMVFEEPNYQALAVQAAAFFVELFAQHGRLHHTYQAEKPGAPASLEDYAFLAASVLAIASSTSDRSKPWLSLAEQLLAYAREHFYDTVSGLYRLNEPESLSDIPITHATDSALPSAIGVLVQALVSAGKLTQRPEYMQHVQQLQARYLPSIALEALPEYAQLIGAFARAAMQAGDAGFAQEMQLLLADKQAKPVVSLRAELASGSEIKPGARVDVLIHLAINPGWMIEALGMADSTTTLDISGANIAMVESLQLPPAVNLPAVGHAPKRVYQGQVSITAQLLCSAQDTRQAIDISVSCHPCDESQCFPPMRLHYQL